MNNRIDNNSQILNEINDFIKMCDLYLSKQISLETVIKSKEFMAQLNRLRFTSIDRYQEHLAKYGIELYTEKKARGIYDYMIYPKGCREKPYVTFIGRKKSEFPQNYPQINHHVTNQPPPANYNNFSHSIPAIQCNKIPLPPHSTFNSILGKRVREDKKQELINRPISCYDRIPVPPPKPAAITPAQYNTVQLFTYPRYNNHTVTQPSTYKLYPYPINIPTFVPVTNLIPPLSAPTVVQTDTVTLLPPESTIDNLVQEKITSPIINTTLIIEEQKIEETETEAEILNNIKTKEEPIESLTPPVVEENYTAILELNQNELLLVIKTLAGKKNNASNCTSLSEGILNYLKTGEKPTSAASREYSLNHFSVDFQYQSMPIYSIKQESEKPNNPRTQVITSSIIDRNTLFGSTTNCDISYQQTGSVTDLTQPIVNVDTCTQKSSDISTLNTDLKLEASLHPDKVSFGIICLGHCGKYLNDPGHMFVYYATPSKVTYIDAQFYHEGKAIFDNLTDNFFILGINRQRNTQNAFARKIFHTQIGPAFNLRPKKDLIFKH
jgi:hypothetical protein